MIIVSIIKERLITSFLFLKRYFKIKNNTIKVSEEEIKNDLCKSSNTADDFYDYNTYLSSINENISSYIIYLRTYLSSVAVSMLNSQFTDSYNDSREAFLNARAQLSLESSDEFLKTSITFTDFYLEKGRIIGQKEDVAIHIKKWVDEFFEIVFDKEQLREEIVFKYEIAMLLNTLLIVNEMGVKTCFES